MELKQKFAKGLSATLLLAGLGLATATQAQTLRFGSNFALDHSSTKAMQVFKSELAKTDVDLDVNLFPALQLGGAQENVDQVRSGAIAGTWIGISYLSRIVPELEAVSIPFAFAERQQAFDLIDGPVGEKFNALLAEKGFVSLGYMELGFRNVTNSKRPLNSASDFEGLKIRLQPNETHLATFRALKANPISMDVKEIYSAMQQGVIDGQENPYSIISTNRFNEVQTYLSDSQHFYDYIVVVVNKDSFERLSASEQAAVTASMTTAINWQREQAAVSDQAAKQALIDAGMVFTPLSAETRAELRQRSSGIVDMLKQKIGAEIVDQVTTELAID